MKKPAKYPQAVPGAQFRVRRTGKGQSRRPEDYHRVRLTAFPRRTAAGWRVEGIVTVAREGSGWYVGQGIDIAPSRLIP